MTSKERVQTVLNGQIPDRVPIAEFAIDFDTVEKIIGHETYHRAKARSRIAFWEGRRAEVIQSWREDYLELVRKLELFDIISFPEATWAVPPETDEPPPKRVDAHTWEDRVGRIYRYSEITADITCIYDPTTWEQTFTIEQFQGALPPPALDPVSFEIRDHIIDRLQAEKYICTPCGGEIGIIFLGGIERGSVELMEHPEVVAAAVDYQLQLQAAHDPLLIHPAADGVILAQDFSATQGPFISPPLFQTLFFTANRQRVQRLQQDFHLKVLKHACGNNWKLLDQFVAIGYDAYQSIQPTAGMDLRAVKAAYGAQLTLWGGVAVEHLISGTPADVRQDVRYAMQWGKPGGRFMLGASHSIAVGTNYDNYLTMLDEYLRLASY
ncbi:uroporphyrinogen decarboxylase family protein [candidate division KSB1 bacterium]|nr:uroporphyrinogen decarboxylase family protein [candidate division KSB1 bacterium]